MVEEVKVTRNYQVTIPYLARSKMGVKVGDVLVADFQGSSVVFQKKSSDITKLHLKIGKKKKVNWMDVEKAVREAGKNIIDERSRR